MAADSGPVSARADRFAWKIAFQYGRGQPVHAGSFIRKREIVLEPELRADSGELARIFIHELFHFVWIRMGNPARSHTKRFSAPN